MKRSLILISIIVTLTFTEKTYCMPWPPEMDVCYIKFNYESGHTYDALTLNVSAPEWASGGSTNEKIAYIKSQSNRKIKVKLWLDRTGVVVEAYAIQSGQGIGNTNTQWFDFLSSQYSSERTLTFNGNVPSSIGKRDFTLKWYAIYPGPYGELTYWIGNTGSHQHYTLLAAPQSPMTVPWTSVLDYACDWASGESTNSGALEDLTYELYNCGAEYSPYENYTRGSYTNLDLTDLLDDLSSNPNNVEMDCRDFSNFLQVLLNSLGGDSEYNRIDRTTYPYYFIYNYLYPAGWGSKEYPDGWNYHQVGWYNSKVADAATKIDNDADPTSSPHSWKLADGDMTLSAYIDKLTETTDVSSVATGTCTVY